MDAELPSPPPPRSLFPVDDGDASTEDSFADFLPSKNVFLLEARKFLAFRRISAWKSARANANFNPNRDEMKLVAIHAHCRHDKLEDLDHKSLVRLLDALSDLFHECLKSAEETFLINQLALGVKEEAEIEYSVEHDSANSPDDLTPFSHHLCEFCASFFNDAGGLERHLSSGCPNDPFRVPVSRSNDDPFLAQAVDSGSNPFASAALFTQNSLDGVADDANAPEEAVEESGDVRDAVLSGDSNATRDCTIQPIVDWVDEDVATDVVETRPTEKLVKKKSGKKTGGDAAAVAPAPDGKKKGRKRGKNRVPKETIGGESAASGGDYCDAANAEGSGQFTADVEDGEPDDGLTCKICGEIFTEKAKLHKHVWKHNRKRSHMCDICGKGFWMKYLLKEHRNTHTGEKPYTCAICGESFSQMQGYNAHKRAHQFEQKRRNDAGSEVVTKEPSKEEFETENPKNQPYLNCRFCGRLCKTLRTLANHENIHTSGISKNSYKYFMEVKEKEFVGEKEHACELCDEKFAYRNSLSYHKRKSHRLFMCGQCGKSYNCSQALNNHLRAHAGERNFECPECHKKYLQQAGLIKHMEIHEGKTFSCEICARTFTRAAYLRKHQVMHGDQDKYAVVKSKRAANCRRQRSGMTDAQKEDYKKERREYMRDWLAKKRQTTIKLLNPVVVSSAFFDDAAPASGAVKTEAATTSKMTTTTTTAAAAAAGAALTSTPSLTVDVGSWSTPSIPQIAVPSGPMVASMTAAPITPVAAPIAPVTSTTIFVPATVVSTAQSSPTIFAPAASAMAMPAASTSASTPSPNGIVPISSLMRTIAAPSGMTSGLTEPQETFVIDSSTVAAIVGSSGGGVAGGDGNGVATHNSGGDLKPLTFALPSNVMEGPSSLNSGGTGEVMKPLTLALPTNIAVSIGLTNALQSANLNQLQIPANVLPVALANGTIANVPISLTNAFFSNDTLSTSLPP